MLIEAPDDPKDFSGKFNTHLSPTDELLFQQWAKDTNRSNDTYDYDLRGAWKEIMSGSMSESANGHLGDRYKKPNHPTFSDQSIYHMKGGNLGGKWSEEGGKTVFTPSATNLKNMSADELRRYFDKVEPGVILNIPKSLADRLYGE